MNETEKILIADDDETFLNSTADLLREKGYVCDCAPDADTVVSMLKAANYDLLITDKNMPGNPDLELIRDIAGIVEGMPVIVVTGFPSINSAIESVQLPVAAYLVKPIEFEELLQQIRTSIAQFKVYRIVSNARQRLKDWRNNLNKIEATMKDTSNNVSSVPVNAFFEITIQNIVENLMDMKVLIEKITGNSDEESVCNIFDSSRMSEIKVGLLESVDILQKTKSSFKSKKLGELREKLEVLAGKL